VPPLVRSSLRCRSELLVANAARKLLHPSMRAHMLTELSLVIEESMAVAPPTK